MQSRLPVFLFALFTASFLCAQDPAVSTTDAENEAKAWLGLIDEGQYGESWQQASQLFRGAVTQEKWEQSLEAIRTPLGNLVSRSLKSAEYRSSLPGAPDGEYVVIQFETSFENKQAAIETVTPMKEKDGNWRVSGYYIR